MGFSDQEQINLVTKVMQAGVIDANASAVWYETFFANNFIVDAGSVWTSLPTLRTLPAGSRATARANAASNPALIQDLSQNAQAVRLTIIAGTNGSTWAAYSVYGNTNSTLLRNWLLPQLIPQANGAPSNGYAIQLYNGNPAAGGVLVSTSAGTTGTGESKSVGWVFNYPSGLLLLSADFRTQITDPWIVGFRYVGPTAGTAPAPQNDFRFDVTASSALSSGEVVSMDPLGSGGVVPARALNSHPIAVGVAASAVASGTPVQVVYGGKFQVLFSSPLATADIGRSVYLDADVPGRASMEAPCLSGQKVIRLGTLLVAAHGSTDGVVALTITPVASLL